MIARLSAFARPSALIGLLTAIPDLSTPEGRSRDRHRRIVLSAGASAASKGVMIAATLISVPLTLHYLGPERYGVWLVISSFSIMLSFADMGLGNGVLNAVAKAHGREDRASIRETVSSGYFALSLAAAAILVGFALAYPFLPWERVFNVDTALARAETGPALATYAVCFALAIPLSLIQKLQVGLQQSFVSSLWQCLGSVFALVGLLIVMELEGGLPWLVAALAGLPLVASLINSLVFFAGQGSDLVPSPSAVSRRGITVALRTGALFFILQIVVSMAYGADTLIIAQVAGAAEVPQYAVPERVFALVSMVLVMFLTPLWPAYGEAIARGDHAWLRRTLKMSLLISAIISSILCGILVLLSPMIVRLWVGDQIQPTWLLLIGLAVWRVIEITANAIVMFLNGTNALRSQVYIALVAGPVMIALKIYLTRTFGIAGIPWGASLAFLLCSAIPFYVVARGILSSDESRPHE
jgi:O-antigen/teichoic acid export membrane protein